MTKTRKQVAAWQRAVQRGRCRTHNIVLNIVVGGYVGTKPKEWLPHEVDMIERRVRRYEELRA